MIVLQRFFQLLFLVLASAILFTIGANLWVVYKTNAFIYADIDDLPVNKTGLLLGTSKNVVGGGNNPYFSNRIDAAARLYHEGKISHIILSGDNETRYYNEPKDMQEALLAKGVPASAMTLDYAGFRTLDSIVRCQKIFGQNQITIITQEFHSFRAVFISQYYNMDAQAFAAEKIPLDQAIKVLTREYFARTLAIIDLYVLNRAPRIMEEGNAVI